MGREIRVKITIMGERSGLGGNLALPENGFHLVGYGGRSKSKNQDQEHDGEGRPKPVAFCFFLLCNDFAKIFGH